ncbi:MAG: hypothetical protein Q7T53_03590 [Deltaproteobacteria bacterium]|nr:hypothetical protein [Deltaproteobacteria bacterium]
MKTRRIIKVTFGALVVGTMIFGSGRFQTQAQQEQPVQSAAATAPVTDCFESREGYTAVTRVENVTPDGNPNVKCSPTTNGVLWWGDPFDGTVPMGDMPAFGPDDKTRGDYETEEAVVKPREPMLMYFNMEPTQNCAFCHNGQTVPFPTDKNPRLLAAHQDIVENSMQLMHGRAAFWCLDCHNATNRNKLIDHKGNEVSFNQPQQLCGKCHGEVYIDWRMGIHGKRIGSWTKGGKKRWWVCTECHNPHTVQVNRFQAIKPELAPALPKGMKDAAHEQHHGGGPAPAAGHGEAAPAKH